MEYKCLSFIVLNRIKENAYDVIILTDKCVLSVYFLRIFFAFYEKCDRIKRVMNGYL